MDIYTLATNKAHEIEHELKHLKRWSTEPLQPEKYKDMGAFGSNTMTFEQWLQFILVPRIHAIVEEKGEFPNNSMLAPYAIRVFDGDPEAGKLHDLLYELDKLINEKNKSTEQPVQTENTPPTESVVYGGMELPPVIYTLIEVLPQFTGDDLESQLQTYDTFLSFLSPSVRPTISKLLSEAAQKTTNESSKIRIQEAAQSVAEGGRAAAPYDHEEAMRKYREEQKKSFPA
jgi:uncharacterized protein YqcC (DUF446 family)